MPNRVLFIGTNRAAFDDIHGMLERNGFAASWCEHAESGRKQLPDTEIAVLGASASSETCTWLAREHPEVEVVLASDRLDTLALARMENAGVEFLEHCDRPDEVLARLRVALRHRDVRREAERLRVAIAEAGGFEDLVGTSLPMQELFALLDRAASTTSSVLITGESGTGKELVARALHRRGRRRERPFVAVNCSAMPETLLESELFGHVKGAFTDARASRQGLFVKASGGTLFLDEIGDMPTSLQPKLLRALQERAVRPVGGDEETAVDTRLVAATNQDLDLAVLDRSFREDLYYRLNVIHLHVPPLRERSGDILLLSQYFVGHYAAVLEKRVQRISPTAAQRLVAYAWPGNVRELQNCIERAVALTQGEAIEVDDLPAKVRDYRRTHMVSAPLGEPPEMVTLEEVERRYIIQVLEHLGGNKKEAARVLGVDRKTLYRKLERYGLGPARC